ncbi:hypothetical protein, partial [Leuconostoc mesenteroides]|uniref:hypothetical protein n=1 Tax=Leuconostoc mesenteroides TaxID=1245 RepID=UPI001C92ECA1
RAGLKIQWWQHRVGSTPTGGIRKVTGWLLFFLIFCIIDYCSTVNKFGILRNIVRNPFILRQTFTAETAAIAFFVPIGKQNWWNILFCNHIVISKHSKKQMR